MKMEEDCILSRKSFFAITAKTNFVKLNNLLIGNLNLKTRQQTKNSFADYFEGEY